MGLAAPERSPASKLLRPESPLTLLSPADINECTLHGCGDPAVEECINSPGTFECVCKAGYTRVQGKCQLEGNSDTNYGTILTVVGVHAVLLMLGVSSVGVHGAGVLFVIYLGGLGAFALAKIYKEGSVWS